MSVRHILAAASVAAVFACASGVHAQTAQRVQAAQTAETSHEAREGADDKAFEAHREKLDKDLAAAQKSGDKASIARIQKEQAADYAHLQRAKTMSTKDTAYDARLKTEEKPH